jgi:hypothetical protein
MSKNQFTDGRTDPNYSSEPHTKKQTETSDHFELLTLNFDDRNLRLRADKV